MLETSRIKSKALKRYWADNDPSKIQSQYRARARRILYALHALSSVQELGNMGYGLHELKGNRKGTYAVFLSANWRITFKWSDEGPYDVEMEDYHGR